MKELYNCLKKVMYLVSLLNTGGNGKVVHNS